MTRKPETAPARKDVSSLEEVDLTDMETVSGGCAACGNPAATHADPRGQAGKQTGRR
jgi:hypothetical protein